MRSMWSLVLGLLALSASVWLLSTQRSCSGGLTMRSPGAPPQTLR